MRWVMDELEPTEHRTQLSDLYVSARWVRDNVLYLCDDLDEAFASVVETHAMALSAPNRTVQAGSAGTISQILFLRGEYAEALRWADECLEGNEAIGNVSGFTAPAAVALAARVTLGLAADTERYLELIEQGLASGRTVQANFRFVADAFLALGDAERAERFVEALRARPNSSGRLREAYLETAVGEVMLGLGRPEEAERPFARALALAETIGARSTLAAAAHVLGGREGQLAEAVVTGPVVAQALVDDARHVARGGVVAERQRDVPLEPVRAERRAGHPRAALEAREELPAGRAPGQVGRRGGRAVHVLGRDVRRCASHEARHVARDDAGALGRVVQALAVVGERVEPELADRVERRGRPARVLDDVDHIAPEGRVVPERERHVAAEQPLDVALVRQVGPPAAEEHQLHHAR